MKVKLNIARVRTPLVKSGHLPRFLEKTADGLEAIGSPESGFFVVNFVVEIGLRRRQIDYLQMKRVIYIPGDRSGLSLLDGDVDYVVLESEISDSATVLLKVMYNGTPLICSVYVSGKACEVFAPELP